MKSMTRSRSRKKTAVFAAQIPFAVLCAFAAPRIGILDLGLDAGSVKGAFGCPSNPRAIAETLSPIGEVFPVAGEDVSKKDVLTRRNMDLLVVPTGSAWPAAATNALVSYLAEGGSLLTCGGYAFDEGFALER